MGSLFAAFHTDARHLLGINAGRVFGEVDSQTRCHWAPCNLQSDNPAVIRYGCGGLVKVLVAEWLYLSNCFQYVMLTLVG